ncbi:MAG: hypothetical protein GC165_19525 [Armatimonadetes bacterium]|nr:hypothetical protein [Armatimonadota bacterium]
MKKREIPSTRLARIREAVHAHDWKSFAELVPEPQLQGATLPRESFAAFLDRYLPSSVPLAIEEHDNGHGRTLIIKIDEPKIREAHLLWVVLREKKGAIKALPGEFEIGDIDFAPMFATIGLHEFPGLMGQFNQNKGGPSSLNGGPIMAGQYLLTLRDRDKLEAMQVPCYSNPTKGARAWDELLDQLYYGLKHEGWNVETLLAAYKMGPEKTPAKDSRRLDLN